MLAFSALKYMVAGVVAGWYGLWAVGRVVRGGWMVRTAVGMVQKVGVGDVYLRGIRLVHIVFFSRLHC